MNWIKGSRTGLALGMALAFRGMVWGAEAAPAQGPVCSELEFGGRAMSVTGSREKFHEYRDVSFFFNELELGVQPSGSPYFLDVDVRNATRGDQSYRVSGGSYGTFRAAASFERLPHNFNKGPFILSGFGTRNLGIDGGIQGALQAGEQTRAERGGDPTTDATGEDAFQQAVIRSLISTAEPSTFKLTRDRAAFAADLNLGSDAKTWVKVTDERREGARLIGAGTYERYAIGATALTHTKDLFFVSGQELAEPIDYQTTSINAGVGMYKKAWSADLEYTFTEFKDNLDALIWANPFRNTDATATSAAGAAAVAGDNGFNRGRFTRGRMGLPPSNQSHEAAASGSVELPLNGRLTGSVGMGLTTQNTALLSYTLNSAIAGVAGGPTNVTEVAALPTPNFRGEVRTLNQSWKLTMKPLEGLGTALKYRYYDYDNRSDQIVFPGYVAFGEAYWRAVRNDPGAPVSNSRPSYTRQSSELSADYELVKGLTVSGEGFWDLWDYRDLRLDKTNELGVGTGLAWHLGHAAKLHGSWRWSHRTAKDYVYGAQAANPEAIGLANYNWADRIRHRGNLRLEVAATDDLSLGAGGQILNDAFGAAERFGLKSQQTAGANFDLTYEPSEALTVSLDYGRERIRSRMQNGAKDNAFNSASALDDTFNGDSFNPLNYWNSTITEDIDTVGLEATFRPVEKVELNGGYSLSYSRMRFGVTNPNAAQAVATFGRDAKLENGIAQDWPDVVSRTHELRAGGSYQLLENLRLGLNYLFEKYRLNDFTNTGTYLAGLSSTENTTRFVFTGANQFDYTAHVVGTSLNWRF